MWMLLKLMLMLRLERKRLRVWRLKRQDGVRLVLGLVLRLEMRLEMRLVKGVHHMHLLRNIADVTPASGLVGRKNQHAIVHAWIHLSAHS